MTNSKPRFASDADKGGQTDSDEIPGAEDDAIKTLKLTDLGYSLLLETVESMRFRFC